MVWIVSLVLIVKYLCDIFGSLYLFIVSGYGFFICFGSGGYFGVNNIF